MNAGLSCSEHQRLKILVEPGCFDCLNLGDVAMLEVLVDRLFELWPNATIQVLTDAPERLLGSCPRAEPIDALGRRIWFQDGCLFSPLHRLLPERLSLRLLTTESALRRRWPSQVETLLRLKTKLLRRDSESLIRFLRAVREADLIVVSGQGSINDTFYAQGLNVLDVLGMAIRNGTPTALFGQGLGPMCNPRLRARAKQVLPNVNLLALREGRAAQQLLDSLSISLSTMMVTGDDAIELAYNLRPRGLGNGIGVNLRVATYSQMNSTHLQTIGSVLRKAASNHGAPMVPVAIAIGDQISDANTIRQLIYGHEPSPLCEDKPDAPEKVILQIGGCHIVVAGSYHAAVFAMAQGIPTICLANSAYYFDKFFGLADQFGTGCKVIRADDAGLSQKLEDAIEDAWSSAEGVRPSLLAAAVRQIEASRAAYHTLYRQLS